MLSVWGLQYLAATMHAVPHFLTLTLDYPMTTSLLSLHQLMPTHLFPTADAQSHTAGGDMANELLITMGAGSDLEEFYPAIAINSLMRILKDQSLQQHHVMAVQALIFVFKSLGIKSVTYLPQVPVLGRIEAAKTYVLFSLPLLTPPR